MRLSRGSGNFVHSSGDARRASRTATASPMVGRVAGIPGDRLPRTRGWAEAGDCEHDAEWPVKRDRELVTRRRFGSPTEGGRGGPKGSRWGLLCDRFRDRRFDLAAIRREFRHPTPPASRAPARTHSPRGARSGRCGGSERRASLISGFVISRSLSDASTGSAGPAGPACPVGSSSAFAVRRVLGRVRRLWCQSALLSLLLVRAAGSRRSGCLSSRTAISTAPRRSPIG